MIRRRRCHALGPDAMRSSCACASACRPLAWASLLHMVHGCTPPPRARLPPVARQHGAAQCCAAVAGGRLRQCRACSRHTATWGVLALLSLCSSPSSVLHQQAVGHTAELRLAGGTMAMNSKPARPHILGAQQPPAADSYSLLPSPTMPEGSCVHIA